MRIVHQVIAGELGGGQLIALRLATAARDAGHDASIVSPTDGPFLDRAARAGIDVSIDNVDDVLRPDRIARYARILRGGRVEVLHTHSHFAGNVAGRLAARLAGIPVVAHMHAENAFRAGGFGRAAQIRLDNATARLCGRILAVSEATRATLERQGYPPETLEVLRNGIDLSSPVDAGGVRAELGVPDRAPLVLHVGRIDPMKGQRELLQAVALAPDVHAILVGEDPHGGTYRASLEREAASLGVAGRVVFAGRRDDVPSLLAAADALVLPSLVEGLSLVILEAMAAARPVVATDVGGTREAVVDGETGILVPARDADALAGAIVELLSDRDRARRLGEAGRRRAAELFDAVRMAQRVLEVYEEVVRKMAA